MLNEYSVLKTNEDDENAMEIMKYKLKLIENEAEWPDP